MDWLKDLITSHPIKSLLVPTSVGALSFLGNLFIALSDGTIDSTELHQLMSSANGLQTLILVIVMIALKANKKDK